MYINNSAFNCAAQLAIRYGIDISPGRIISDLNLDDQLRGDVTVKELSACLSHWGLNTVTVYNGSPNMVVENVNEGRSAVVLFGSEDLPFYACCTAPKAGVIKINRYPAILEIPAVTASSQFAQMRSTVLLVQKEPFKAISSSYKLSQDARSNSGSIVVNDSKTKQNVVESAKPLINQGKFIRVFDDVYLGKFSRGGLLIGELPIENVGDQPVDIIAVKGACSCFKRADYSSHINPHQKSAIKVTFDPPNTSEPRSFSTAVVVETTDPSLKITQVNVRAEPDLTKFLYTIPRHIDFGTIGSENFTDGAIEVSVLRLGSQPNNVKVAQINYDKTKISLAELPVRHKIGFGANEIIGRYTIKIVPNHGDSGLLQTSIDFVTSDENYKVLPVAVRAWIAD